MKILVTGGLGFIGSAFIRRRLAEHPEDSIINLDAETYAAQRDAVESPDPSRYRLVVGDISESEVVRPLVDEADSVVHFAAETHVDRSVSGPAAFVRTNLVGTFTLLEAARAAGLKRFHHVSTDEVFGSLQLGSPIRFTENTPYDPRSPYSASKAGSDHLVRAYVHTYGLPATLSNCSNNYGPWQYPEKLIPVLSLKALRGEPLPVYGDGLNVRDWIHVEDHAAGVSLCLDRGAAGETYLFGGDAERSNLAVVEAVLASSPGSHSEITFVQDRPGHDRRYAIDSAKAERELGWTRRYGFDEGIAATVAWYRGHAAQLRTDEQGTHAVPR